MARRSQASRPSVLFLGTPAFAVPSLDALARLAGRGEIQLAGVVTRPDRMGHRRRVTAPPVKERAVALGVPVLQAAKLRAEMLEPAGMRPDALVWAAYGGIVPASLIGAAGGRALNVHPSLLPRWRGAEPVGHAILAGDPETGVTLMEGTAELDAGPIVAQQRVAIDPGETTAELEARLAEVGARMLERDLTRYLSGELRPVAQDASRVTWAPKFDPKAGELDLARPAEELVRVVRAFTPDPGAYSFYKGARLGVLRASVAGGSPAEHGVVRLRAGVPYVAAAAGGWLRLDEVRPAGKRAMSGADWARGRRDLDGGRVPS